MNKWYFINSGTQSASYNMALDELLCTWQRQDPTFLPTLRFYFWHSPTLTIGHFQKAEKEINFDNLREHGVAFIRRQTGGRAVLHDNELTYSVTLPDSYPHMPKDVVSSYRVLTQGLIEGYKMLGLDPKFSIPEKEKLEKEKTAVCFDTPSMYEVVINGKKIAGSAQVRKDGMILQHGSVPVFIDVDLLYDMFHFKNDKLKARMKANFNACGIQDFLGKATPLPDLIAPFKAGFAKGLAIELIDYVLTDDQERQVHQLAKSKYETKEWNHATF